MSALFVMPTATEGTVGADGSRRVGLSREKVKQQFRARSRPFAGIGLLLLLVIGAWPAGAQDESAAQEEGLKPKFELGLEAKAHLRRSDDNRFAVNFPFPEILPPGRSAELRTVNPGSHLEVSLLTLRIDAVWSPAFRVHARIDFIDLYDRNPTSSDDDIDVDELWIRFGRETEPAILPQKPGAYVKVGKIPKFERQDDRHLESYGLVSTAFNRFEDLGVELGADLGRHVYVKASVTQGNPVFFRDPNALAGDNGTPAGLDPAREPALNSGVLILYDAEVEDVDTDGEEELGAGLGFRFGDQVGRTGIDLLVWGYRRDLAETVHLTGTAYGGDLDLLRGPFNAVSLPITDGEKEEYGANLWLYSGGLSFFAQYVDQELAGLPRTGVEGELAWQLNLPLKWAIAGRQLFPHIQPALRFSKLDPDIIGGDPRFPAPSVRWEWEKIDFGLRLGIVDQTDLTVEYSDNDFILGDGSERSNNELLVTLRWRL